MGRWGDGAMSRVANARKGDKALDELIFRLKVLLRYSVDLRRFDGFSIGRGFLVDREYLRELEGRSRMV